MKQLHPIRFNNALRVAAEIVNTDDLPTKWPVLIIRDVYGRLRFVINTIKADYPEAARISLEVSMQGLGAFASPGTVLFQDDFSDPDQLFSSLDWHETIIEGEELEDGHYSSELTVNLLDRQIVGQNWLRTTNDADAPKHPPRIVFYGIKGGVGRSTALALLAYTLARKGKRVLLLDLDLESPGLSGLLLPPDRAAEYGLVDWFVEDAVGQGNDVISKLIVDSPLAENTTGAIRVAAAMGQGETAYLAKLARVYADVPNSTTGPTHFALRLEHLVMMLEKQEQPDVVLIDSRAGLHDLAAISIARLSTLALLFATDTAQNWQGYRQLFGHWQARPEVLRHVRKKLAIVQALFPESDQAERASRFRQNSYDLFASTLYDQIPAGSNTSLDAFSFGLDAEDAPHFPLQVRWNARLQEFDPLLPVSKGGVNDAEIEGAFGPFFEEIVSMVLGE